MNRNVIILALHKLYRINFTQLFIQDAVKSGKKSYMRHYVPYKPGDEFKYRTREGINTLHFQWIFLSFKTNFNEIPERQRELKRIGNMIDDIIASKWSRMNENPAQNVRLHKKKIYRIYFILFFGEKKENHKKAVVHLMLECMFLFAGITK